MDVKSGYKPGTSDFLSIVLHMMKIWNFCSPKKSMQKHEPKNWPFSGTGHEFAYCTRAMWTLEKIWTHFEVLHSEFMIPGFHDYSLEPKITKCGDLLYGHRVERK